MKKIILTMIMLLTFININNVNAQTTYRDVFKYTNTKFNMGFHFGGIGCFDDLGLQEILVSTTIYGVYADFGG